ncbi:MAG: SRPBCC family protein [Alphaproteobacteria bacterium]|nr:SRPBCC family protein [Alphaproteobacteria bacterium]MBU0798116.1 SRPBCC family protein [Alphaproteobacteria bacterium]MBU0887067.1 SRPBCC family protein [Alphaproteobacteria bacterium]MBU1814317.1 SRPBCC family protein [Alphaproteobacteria bacterium]
MTAHPIELTVNGRRVSGMAEPRTHLAEFLRGPLGLTGTHLGCEQGVCGACTVLIDGKPQRSCLTFAVSCNGDEIRTVEGFDDDPVMTELREAFSAHHALQCGYCTPGMLVTARDIVTRLGDVDEETIRRELSGNICRCTGYVGIVGAIRQVAAGKTAVAQNWNFEARHDAVAAKTVEAAPAAEAAKPASMDFSTAGDGFSVLKQQVTVPAPADQVWAVLGDIRRMAACLPGASVDTVEGDRVTGSLTISFGPIKASFAGEGEVARDESARTGTVKGRGRDAKGGSSATGEIAYAVLPQGEGTIIDVTVRYKLTGPLAQFGRSALVTDFARRMTDLFAANLTAMLTGTPGAEPARSELSFLTVASMMLGALRDRLKALIGR